MPLHFFRHATNQREFALTSDETGTCLPAAQAGAAEWLHWQTCDDVVTQRITTQFDDREAFCNDLADKGYHVFYWPPLRSPEMVI